MDQLFLPAAQLGGTVFITVTFLQYLTRRDGEWIKALNKGSNSDIKLARSLQKLTDIIGKNTIVVKKNIESTDKNTKVVRTINGNGKY